MNRNERLKLYWKMYTVAVGILILEQSERIYWSTTPCGHCGMLLEFKKAFTGLPELSKQFKGYYYNNTVYWHPPGDWKPRVKDLLEAIKLASE